MSVFRKFIDYLRQPQANSLTFEQRSVRSSARASWVAAVLATVAIAFGFYQFRESVREQHKALLLQKEQFEYQRAKDSANDISTKQQFDAALAVSSKQADALSSQSHASDIQAQVLQRNFDEQQLQNLPTITFKLGLSENLDEPSEFDLYGIAYIDLRTPIVSVQTRFIMIDEAVDGEIYERNLYPQRPSKYDSVMLSYKKFKFCDTCHGGQVHVILLVEYQLVNSPKHFMEYKIFKFPTHSADDFFFRSGSLTTNAAINMMNRLTVTGEFPWMRTMRFDRAIQD